MKKVARYIGIIAATVVVTLVVGRFAFPVWRGPVQNPTEPLEVVPGWIAAGRCTEMDAEERAREDLVLRVFRDFRQLGGMRLAAVRHFGQQHYRGVEDKPVPLCPAHDLDPEISDLALERDYFARPYLHAEGVRLARRLGPRDPRIVEAVARTAFNSHAITTEYPELRSDIRSLARTTLAEFGSAAARWSDDAFQKINVNDALGTSAAQIAVATGHPQALAEVSRLLKQILITYPGDPIPRPARNRFYELSYALAAVGPKARPHMDPVIEIMSRKIESWAPPFGMIALAPRRMCRVLELIGGPDAERILAEEACRPKVDVFEQ